MLAGLITSSANIGSRTDTGLGRSCISVTLSRHSTFLVTDEFDGDANGEKGCWSSSDESWRKKKIGWMRHHTVQTTKWNNGMICGEPLFFLWGFSSAFNIITENLDKYQMWHIFFHLRGARWEIN